MLIDAHTGVLILLDLSLFIIDKTMAALLQGSRTRSRIQLEEKEKRK